MKDGKDQNDWKWLRVFSPYSEQCWQEPDALSYTLPCLSQGELPFYLIFCDLELSSMIKITAKCEKIQLFLFMYLLTFKLASSPGSKPFRSPPREEAEGAGEMDQNWPSPYLIICIVIPPCPKGTCLKDLKISLLK